MSKMGPSRAEHAASRLGLHPEPGAPLWVESGSDQGWLGEEHAEWTPAVFIGHLPKGDVYVVGVKGLSGTALKVRRYVTAAYVRHRRDANRPVDAVWLHHKSSILRRLKSGARYR